MKKTSAPGVYYSSLGLLLAAAGATSWAAATTLNFDEVADNTVINTRYAPDVTLSNPLGGDVYARSSGTFAPSLPNVVSLVSTAQSACCPFFDAASGAVEAHFAAPQRVVSIDARPVGPLEFVGELKNRPRLEAYDTAHNFLGSVMYQGALPTNCCWEVGPTETLTYTSSSANIGYVRLTSQTSQSALHTYGLFDNLRFSPGDQMNSWIGAEGGFWESASQWSLGVPPGAGQSIFITNASFKVIQLYSPLPVATLTISNLTIDGNVLQVGNVSEGPFRVHGDLDIGRAGSFWMSGSATTLVSGALSVESTAFVHGGLLLATNQPTRCNALLSIHNGVMRTRDLFVGYGAAGSLLVSNTGALFTDSSLLGKWNPGNSAQVVGTGSVWSNQFDLSVGEDHGGNELTISSAGQVFNNFGTIGRNAGSASNAVWVTGAGSIWSNRADLSVGDWGSGNRMTIAVGGNVFNEFGRIGFHDSGSNNTALVTGSGSVWSNRSELHVGAIGPSCSLVVSNGGQVFDSRGVIGYWPGSNQVVMTGNGSLWSNRTDLLVGLYGPGNALIVSNGALVVSDRGYVGQTDSSVGNRVVVGPEGLWRNTGAIYVGYDGSGNTLSVTGGSVLTESLEIGATSLAVSNRLDVASGSVTVTTPRRTGTLVVGGGGGRADLNIHGGTVTTDRLYATNGPTSVVTFNDGLLESRGTVVSNGQWFIVGGPGLRSSATYRMLGGSHAFFSGLRIRRLSALTGCGTLAGKVQVDAGASVVTDCSTGMTFTGNVTNYGTLRASPGTTLTFTGTLVNRGVIDIIYGQMVVGEPFINEGVVLDRDGDADHDGLSNWEESEAGTDPLDSQSVLRITSVTRQGQNLLVTWQGGGEHTNLLEVATRATNWWNSFTDLTGPVRLQGSGLVSTNHLDVGGATNKSGRFYRVRLVH